MKTVGHNSIAAEVIRQYVEKIERLEDEKSNIAVDIRGVYAEAAGNGYDKKILRKVIALRKKNAADREEEAMLMDIYMRALGMLV